MIIQLLDVLSPKEKENYDRWMDAHKLVCGCSGTTLHFTRGAIGTTVMISCPTLTNKHDLTDYDTW